MDITCHFVLLMVHFEPISVFGFGQQLLALMVNFKSCSEVCHGPPDQ